MQYTNVTRGKFNTFIPDLIPRFIVYPEFIFKNIAINLIISTIYFVHAQ